MNSKKTNAQLTITLLLLFATIFSYAGNQKNPFVQAIQLFDAGNYTEAEKILKSLLDEKPDHLMVNYYYGACRTENRHYGSDEISYLLNGSTGESPLETDYYLGIQYHAQNRWEEALKYYTRFKSKLNNEQQKEVQLSDKIQQCYEKKNPFVNKNASHETDVLPTAIPREKEIEEYTPIIDENSTVSESAIDSIKTIIPDTAKTLIGRIEIPIIPEKTIKKTTPINFSIGNEFTYRDSTNFRTKPGLKYYYEGTKKQKELASRLEEVENLRKKYGSAKSYTEKQAFGEKILAAETKNYEEQSEVIRLLSQAEQAEIRYWQNAPSDEKETFKEALQTYSKSLLKLEKNTELDTSAFINPQILLVANSTTPATKEDTDDELIYKIQLGAYSRGLPSYVKTTFKKLSYIRNIEHYTDDNKVVIYTTGNLTNYNDALKMQHQVRQEGVEDAYVVPYYNGKRITLKEAKVIEAGK